MNDLIKNIKENGTASSALLPQVIDNVALKKQIKIFIELTNQQYRIEDNAGGAVYEGFIKALESDRSNYIEYMDRINEFEIELAISDSGNDEFILQRAAIVGDENKRCSAVAATSFSITNSVGIAFEIIYVSFIGDNDERVFELVKRGFDYNDETQEFRTHKDITDLTTFERIY